MQTFWSFEEAHEKACIKGNNTGQIIYQITSGSKKELFHENFPPVSRFIPASTFIVFGNFPTSKFIQDSRVHHILILNRKRVGVILEMSPLLNVYTTVNYSELEYLLTNAH